MKILKISASVLPILSIILITTLALHKHFLPTKTKVENYTGENYKEKTISLIKEFEGFAENVYIDNDGTNKIGYGFPANGKHKISKEEADKILRKEFDKREKDILKKEEELNLGLDFQHRYALISFYYNTGSLEIMKNLTESEWKKYNRASGKKLNGLIKRRNAEWEIFNS